MSAMKINGVEIDPDTCYEPSATSKALKRKESTLALDRCRGKGVEYIKIGRNIFYEGRAILAYIEQQRRPTRELGSASSARRRHSRQRPSPR
jgi:hypothetical protein